MSALHLSRLTYSWPGSPRRIHDITLTVPDGLVALVGRNGIGKSTVLRLLAGQIPPDSGAAEARGSVAYVPQQPLRSGTVAGALGIGETLAALRRIEAGSVDPRDYDAVGDDWDVEATAAVALEGLGLRGLTPERTVATLSGGERTLLAIAAALRTSPDALLLDEPTNNLDEPTAERAIGRLASRAGTTLVATHDPRLLRRVDAIVELVEDDERRVSARLVGGGLDTLEEVRAEESAAAERRLTSAASRLARETADARAHREGASAKERYGRKQRETRRFIGGAADAKRNQAESTAGRTSALHAARQEEAADALAEAKAAIPRDRRIVVDLPDTEVRARQRVLDARGLVTRTGLVADASVMGPERIAVLGPNGVGKTTLLETLIGLRPISGGEVERHVPAGYLPQGLGLPGDAVTALEAVAVAAPDRPVGELRDQLGRFQLRGSRVEATLGTLSGGERLRVALARVLLAEPAPRLLVLDEPTNDLDLDSRERLLEALGEFRGAVLLVSHDPEFRASAGLTRTWTLGAGGLVDAAV